MRTFLACLLLVGLGLASPASAECIGTQAFSTCTDDSGNTYDIQRFGNQTFMTGHNSRTGSHWSEDTMTFGNTTFIDGKASNGSNWNETQQRIGNMEFYSGRDSRGQSFSGSRYLAPDPIPDESLSNDDDESFGNSDDDDNWDSSDGSDGSE
jgi:hypothetical protein